MADTIELVESTNGYADSPLGNNINLFVGESSVKYPNILVKSPNDLPKVLISKGADIKIKAQVLINRTSSSNLSEDDAKALADQIAVQMRNQGFLNCTYKVNFIPYSSKVKMEGSAIIPKLMSTGASAYASGNEVHFGNATPGQKLLGHELTHVVQQ